MQTPKEWWRDQFSSKPGPARIRVTMNRAFTAAEAEAAKTFANDLLAATGGRLRLRVSSNRVFVESYTANSRLAYKMVAALAEHSYVNVYPLAVRTFRELVK